MKRIFLLFTGLSMAGQVLAYNIDYVVEVHFGAGSTGRVIAKLHDNYWGTGQVYVDAPAGGSGGSGGVVVANVMHYWQSGTRYCNWFYADVDEGTIDSDGIFIIDTTTGGQIGTAAESTLFAIVVNEGVEIRLIVYVDAPPNTLLVRYRGINNSTDPVAAAVVFNMGVEEIEYLTTELIPQTQTEADSTEIHVFAKELRGELPLSAYVRWYQDGNVVASSSPINFVETNPQTHVSEIHELEYTPVPDPRYSISGSFQNGTSNSLTAKATLITSSGGTILTLGTVAAGSYTIPSTAFFKHYGDLAEGEIPKTVSFQLVDGSGRVVASSGTINMYENADRRIWVGSGSVSADSLPDAPPPPPPPDPDDPDNPLPPGSDPDPDTPPPPKPPPQPNPNPDGVDYKKMSDAMEYALQEQGVSGVDDSVRELTDAVENMDSGPAGTYSDSTGFNGTGDFDTAASGAKGEIDGMDWGGALSGFADRFKSALIRIFTISFPELGQSQTITFEMPSYMGAEIPALHIDLADLQYVYLLRHLQVIALAIWGIRQCMHIFNTTFQ